MCEVVLFSDNYSKINNYENRDLGLSEHINSLLNPKQLADHFSIVGS